MWRREEGEVAGEKMMAISECDVALAHLGREAALKDTFALISFQGVDLQQ